jgi:hypothetical protein
MHRKGAFWNFYIEAFLKAVKALFGCETASQNKHILI